MNRGLAALIKTRTRDATSACTDTAAVFLADALTLTATGGRAAFLLPRSVLASRDATKIRERVATRSVIEHIWISGEHAFDDALVATCALVVRNERGPQTPIERTHSLGFHVLPAAEPPVAGSDGSETWSGLTAAAHGIPVIEHTTAGEIGTIATATADFRDEYYGLAGFIVEHEETMPDELYPPLITSGMIDPAVCRWGERASRVLKQRWLAPRIDRNAMRTSGTLSGWIDRRCKPKLLVATQSRVIELIVDEPGHKLPCMPVISVTPNDRSEIWHIAATLGSPTASAIAMTRYLGTALTPDAIKLSAKQILKLPIPNRSAAWDEAAGLYRRANHAITDSERLRFLVDSGIRMCDAFGVSVSDQAELMAWWTPRLERALTQSARGRSKYKEKANQ